MKHILAITTTCETAMNRAMKTIYTKWPRWDSNSLTETTVKQITYTITTYLVVQNPVHFMTSTQICKQLSMLGLHSHRLLRLAS